MEIAPSLRIDAESAIAATHTWLREIIVGWDLCPFARAPIDSDRLRVVACTSEDPEILMEELVTEMLRLADAMPAALETTIVVHPNCLHDFADQLDLMDAVERLLVAVDVAQVVQAVSFHPDYEFGDAQDPAEHYANRSPYPCVHLLRHASVQAASGGAVDIAKISADNAAKLRKLGPERLREIYAAFRQPSGSEGTPTSAPEPAG